MERLDQGTVPPDKTHPGGTVLLDKTHPRGTVPPYKTHIEGTVQIMLDPKKMLGLRKILGWKKNKVKKI